MRIGTMLPRKTRRRMRREMGTLRMNLRTFKFISCTALKCSEICDSIHPYQSGARIF
ncbi:MULTISPECIES: hypothetical protein [unclassified Oceanispirochaeta]|uniref:hypothetical protein n=1 Tax=unclassified Oceanispirochaeta TaxID=2635722 RepID=UPI001314F793|nr:MULTISPECIES: hypothetical protein [unclassified Oceanispirochaeta]MBF9017003.1 hypothetical protein [Oceanispirochaeta sp. M2]NPD73366.1 hypothetical protein [Oceanispirochaeta sp. M1]